MNPDPDDALHFILVYGSIAVDVIHVEGPVELVARVSLVWGDVDGQQELFELDGAAAVLVKGPEDVFAELFRISSREELGIHLLELLLR